MDDRNDLRNVVRVNSKTNEEISIEDFEFLMVLGKGGFGKVFLVENKITNELFAIKTIRKDVLIK